MPNEDRIDRCRGALFGLAIGDALGAAVEFQAPGSFEPVTGYCDGGPHKLNAGEWTDDTSMALAMADSIAAVGWDLNDQANRYLDWWRNGTYSVNGRCFDIGNTCASALSRYEINRDATRSGETSERQSGNGSIMRLAPVVIWRPHTSHNHIQQLAEQSSIPTHASWQCRSACRYLASVLLELIRGGKRETILSPDWRVLKDMDSHEKLEFHIFDIARGCYREKTESQITGSGWVVNSLEAALWAFSTSNSFEQAVLKAVNLGDDADTTGAVCGQLAGAYWGESGIPESLKSGLAKPEMIENALAGLMN